MNEFWWPIVSWYGGCVLIVLSLKGLSLKGLSFAGAKDDEDILKRPSKYAPKHEKPVFPPPKPVQALPHDVELVNPVIVSWTHQMQKAELTRLTNTL